MPIKTRKLLGGAETGVDVFIVDEADNVLASYTYPPIADEEINVTQFIAPITFNLIENGNIVLTDTVAYGDNINITID